MAVVHDYECAAHGVFEGTEPKCPCGCPEAFSTIVFLKPVGTRSAGTKFVDAQLRGLANDFKLRDIKNGKDGTSVMDSIRKGEDFTPRSVPLQHAKPGWSGRQEKPPDAGAAGLLFGRPGENALQNYSKELAPVVGQLTQPKPKFVNPPNPSPEAFK